MGMGLEVGEERRKKGTKERQNEEMSGDGHHV